MKPYERRREPGPVTRFLLGGLLVFVAMVYGLMAVILPPQMLSYPATPILIMVGLILWLLPDIGGIYFNQLQKLMIAYVAINTAWPIYLALSLPGLPWISLTRIVLFLVIAVFLWNFSTSREMRDKLRDSVSETPVVMKIFWLYWLTTLFSIAFASPISEAIVKFLNNQIYLTMVLIATLLLATRAGYVFRFLRTMVLATIITLVFSIYEYQIQQVPWLNYIPPFIKIEPELLEILSSVQSRAGTNIYRVRGPFIVSLYYSEFLTMVFPFFLYFTIKERRLLPLIAAIGATLACMTVMYFTGARSAILGMLITFVLYPFYLAVRRYIEHSRSIVSASLLMAYPVILAVTSMVVVLWPRAHIMILGGGQHQASSNARAEQWSMGIPKILSHPFGHGIGRGNEALGFVNPAGKGTVDSYFLTLLLDTGVLSLPLFIALFLLPALLAFKYYRDAKTPEQETLAPLSIALINFIIVKSVLTSETNIPLAIAFVGCIVGLIWQRHRLPEARGEAPALPPDSLGKARLGPPAIAAPRPGPVATALPAPGYGR